MPSCMPMYSVAKTESRDYLKLVVSSEVVFFEFSLALRVFGTSYFVSHKIFSASALLHQQVHVFCLPVTIIFACYDTNLICFQFVSPAGLMHDSQNCPSTRFSSLHLWIRGAHRPTRCPNLIWEFCLFAATVKRSVLFCLLTATLQLWLLKVTEVYFAQNLCRPCAPSDLYFDAYMNEMS
jgi:hypothetical protein